jgi:hypothetical protein
MEASMIRINRSLRGMIGLGVLAVSTAARAENPLGVYIGVGVGESQIGNSSDYYNSYGYSGGFHDHDAAWKVIAGLRPIPLVGAEFEYIDFGNAGGNSGTYSGTYDYGVSAHPKATVLYGLGYLPLPLPFLDVYGKLGVAHLQTDNSYYYSDVCPLPIAAPAGCTAGSSRLDREDTRFAYGAGVQAKFQDFAFRGEYERISSPYGDPNTLMASVTWTF